MKKLLLLLVLTYWGCSNNPDNNQSDNILATVGDYTITEEDFLLNYEFGLPQNKLGDNPERTYLQKMINEALIAQHGYAMKLDTASNIQHAIKTITQESLIEKVFDTYVTDQIEVTDEEIKAEINKAAVSFQLKYLPAQSEGHALQLKQQVEADGFDAVVTRYEDEMLSGQISEDDFTTPYMSTEEIDPLLLDLVQNLELKTISEPVFYNGQWFLFMVNNIRRKPVAPEDYIQKAETYRKVVFNRKAMQMAEVFVSDLMTPLDVRTKREAFEILANATYNWLYDEIPTGDLVAKAQTENTTYLRQINSILKDELVSWTEDSWTVEEFLTHFSPGRHQLRTGDLQKFKQAFSDVIALTVRDYYLMEMGEEGNLEESDEVQKEVQQWANKWVFQSARQHYLNQLTFNDEEVEKYYQLNSGDYPFIKSEVVEYSKLADQTKRRVRRDYLTFHLNEYADSLSQTIPVSINEEKWISVLEQVDANRPEIPTQLFKQNSNRMAFPVVDPNW